MIEISKELYNLADLHNIVLQYYKENNIDLKTPFRIGTTIEADMKNCYIVKIMPLEYKGLSYILSSM